MKKKYPIFLPEGKMRMGFQRIKWLLYK